MRGLTHGGRGGLLLHLVVPCRPRRLSNRSLALDLPDPSPPVVACLGVPSRPHDPYGILLSRCLILRGTLTRKVLTYLPYSKLSTRYLTLG